MKTILILMIFALPIFFFLWHRKSRSEALSLGLRPSHGVKPDVGKSELLGQVELKSEWLQTEDEIYVSRCSFDSGRAAFSFRGHILMGKISPVPSQLMALTDEARRVYGQGYRASGKLLEESGLNLVVFESNPKAEAFLKFVERWRKKFSIEIVDSMLLVSCGWRSNDVEQAIEIVREYRRIESSVHKN